MKNLEQQQTALDWLQNAINKQGESHLFSLRELLIIAKEHEKEQIMEAYRSGVQDYKFHHQGEIIRMEEYYKKTYNK